MLAVGTQEGVHLFDSGSGSPAGTALEECAIGGLCALPGAEPQVYAAARESGIFRLTPSGEWVNVLDGIDARSVAVGGDGAIYAGAHPAAIYRSLDGGAQWEELSGLLDLPTAPTWNFPNPPHYGLVRSLDCSSLDAKTVYAGVEVGGVVISNDRGDSWRDAREGLHIDVHSVTSVASGGSDTLYAATGKGFYRSRNAGSTWESGCDGLLGLYMFPVAVHPGDPQTVFTAASQGRPRYWRRRPEGAAAAIYRSRDGGERWERAMGGLPETLEAAVDAITVDPADASRVYAGTTKGQLMVSETQGGTWDTIAEGLPIIHNIAVW